VGLRRSRIPTRAGRTTPSMTSRPFMLAATTPSRSTGGRGQPVPGESSRGGPRQAAREPTRIRSNGEFRCRPRAPAAHPAPISLSGLTRRSLAARPDTAEPRVGSEQRLPRRLMLPLSLDPQPVDCGQRRVRRVFCHLFCNPRPRRACRKPSPPWPSAATLPLRNGSSGFGNAVGTEVPIKYTLHLHPFAFPHKASQAS